MVTQERESQEARQALDRWVLARTLFHATQWAQEVPQTSAEQKRKRPPPGQDERIKKYQRFRTDHDREWQQAQQHPAALYRFMGLDDELVVRVFGEPPSELEIRRNHGTQGLDYEEGKLLSTLAQRWSKTFGIEQPEGGQA